MNAKKHEELRGECAWYFAVFAPLYGRTAYVADLIPYQDVDRWQEKMFDSLARYLPLDKFFKTYGDGPAGKAPLGWHTQVAKLRHDLHDRVSVIAMANDRSLHSEIFARWPDMEAHLAARRFS